jgi:hypothetical protein
LKKEKQKTNIVRVAGRRRMSIKEMEIRNTGV